MKLIIITVLIMMLIWQGCQSFFPVGEGQKINLNDYDSKDIQIDLVDGTEITSKAYAHKLVTEPSDFIQGLGYLNIRLQYKKYYFYNKNEFDSIGTLSANGNHYAICYLKNSNRIIYESDSYLRIIRQDSTGYFIAQEWVKNGMKFIKASRVELNKIQKIEIKKIDGLKTAGVIILALGYLGIMIALSKLRGFDLSNGTK